jgi:hypothetical protein
MVAGQPQSPYLGEVGVCVLIDAHRVFGFEQIDDLAVGVGRLFDDVAPMAPHPLEIENDEALLGLRAGEELGTPIFPDEALVIGRSRSNIVTSVEIRFTDQVRRVPPKSFTEASKYCVPS